MAERRKQNGDPRESITERYPTKEDYIFKVTECLLELRRQRFLLDEDVANLLKQAAQQSALIDDLRNGGLPFVAEIAMEEGARAGLEYFNKLRDADMLWWYGLNSGQFMNRINSKGYKLMSADKLETALEVFKLNTMLFPKAWNVWDSMAECYYKMKKFDLSIKHYEKSLKLNPGNDNGKKMIERIKKEQKKN